MKSFSPYIIFLMSCMSIVWLSSCTKTPDISPSPVWATGAVSSVLSPMKIEHVEADRLIFHSFAELKKSSDFVGIVQPLVDFSERKHENGYMEDGALGHFSTRTEVRVIKVFKGDVKPGTIMEIIEPISIVYNGEENVKIAIDEYEELPADKPSVVFLQYNTFGQLGINNAQDSVYSPKKDKDKKSKNFTDPIRSEIYKGLVEEKMLEE